LSEPQFRKVLLLVALIGLLLGLARRLGVAIPIDSAAFWTAGSVPIVAALLAWIVRDVRSGGPGAEAIVLVAIVAALVLGQALTANVLAVMYCAGTLLDGLVRTHAERPLLQLAERAPRTANRKIAAGLEVVPVDAVEIGDELLVRAGDTVPVDGVLVTDTALIDEAAVTGEPLAEVLLAGDTLRSGTKNAGETLLMRATAAASDSTYAGMARLAAAARSADAPTIRRVDGFAVALVPVTLLAAGFAWYVAQDPLRALAVLAVVTPCPLLLAAPVAFIGGVSRAARAGVLAKGSAALEALAGVETAIFDKTGTLTQGGADLIEQETAPGREPDEVLRLLASLEQGARHVLSEAILRAARTRGLKPSPAQDLRLHRGAGIEGRVGETRLLAGARRLVLTNGSIPIWAENGERRYRNQPVLRVYAAIDGRLAGVFTFGDSLRGDAGNALATLRAGGVKRVVMLTGDDAAAADRVARQLKLDAVTANATPAQKAMTVRAETARAPTMMVGDGVNDAPSLANATVGVAMRATGAAVSSPAAAIVMLTDRLRPLAETFLIARRTRLIAIESVAIGLALTGAAMIAAATGLVDPLEGAILRAGIDVGVMLSALRALNGPTGDFPGHTGSSLPF